MENKEAFDEECDKYLQKRIKAKDPLAMFLVGSDQYGKGDDVGAFEWCTKAADLGNAEAHCLLAQLYRQGQGNGVEKDSRKKTHHLEEAAISGHPGARGNLANYEFEYGDPERAVKHWIIAANQGYDKPIKCLMELFKQKYVLK